jgi:5'-methylthioadenosine phosphorylase
VSQSTIGVFGGSGLYRFLDDEGSVEQVVVDTPYGAPSAVVSLGQLGAHRVAFLPRHGTAHDVPPHRINFRANVWALRSLGVERIVAPCATGSLRVDFRPGDLVVCDQLIDRTTGRAATYFDGPEVQHVSFADPYCPTLRHTLAEHATEIAATVHREGTVVVIDGPRFSTRAESRGYRSAGGDLVNMTQQPEAVLARELGICYASIAVVTDYDAGLDDDPTLAPVQQHEVLARFEATLPVLREVLRATIVALPPERRCGCAGVPAPIRAEPAR